MSRASPVPWWKNPQTIISSLVGLGAMGSWTISQFVADARQTARVEQVEERVEDLDQTVREQDKELEQTAVQYQLIQQSLGGIQETLKELKGKR